MDYSTSLKRGLLRRVGREVLDFAIILLLLVPTLYLFFSILSFGQDRSLGAFVSFCRDLGIDEDGRAILPQFWRSLHVSLFLIAGSLAISLPISVGVGWWGSLNPKASYLKILLILISSVPSFALAYLFQPFSNALFFPILTLALGDLTLSVVASHVMKDMSLELQRNYVRTAIAKGVAPAKHYWRRLAVEVLSVSKLRISYLIGGTVVIERIFSLRGLGNMAVMAVKRNPPDVKILLWVCFFSVVLVYLLNLAEGLVRECLMPSLRSEESKLRLRERLVTVWTWLTHVSRRPFSSRPPLASIRPLASGRNDLQWKASGRRLIYLLEQLPVVGRLRAFLSYSPANRFKFACGLALWSAALVSVAAFTAAPLMSSTGLLGATSTDQDVLGLTLLAGRRLLLPACLGVLIPIVLGVAFGAIAGYFRESVSSRIIGYVMSLLDAMPRLVLVMIFAVAVKADEFYLYKVIPFIGFTFTPVIYEHVRKRVEYLQRMHFVETERALGASRVRILFRHLLFNNCRSIVSVHGVHLLGQIVLLDAAFDYLGLAQPEHYTWGALFYNAVYDALMGGESNPWAYLTPLGAILLMVSASITLSDGLDAVLEPPPQEVI